jgi:ABC-type multidrug transport system fused ATPase/permease subunit
MGFHGGGWWAYLSHDEKQDRPVVTRDLLARVGTFARPYTREVLLLLVSILLTTAITLVSPLLMRSLIDDAIPNGDRRLLNLLAVALVTVPILNGLVGVWQRKLSSFVGESVIFDLRCTLYEHMQQMSLRFFTQSRTGELMSRLNNDVIGAQRAISDTIVTIISNLVSLVGTLDHFADAGVAADAAGAGNFAVLCAARAAGGAHLARFAAQVAGDQRGDECDDERNAQRQRGAAGEAVWPPGAGDGALCR